ncbi:MAG: hypothetical protein AB7U29_10700 [Desulfobulbus sp.]
MMVPEAVFVGIETAAFKGVVHDEKRKTLQRIRRENAVLFNEYMVNLVMKNKKLMKKRVSPNS